MAVAVELKEATMVRVKANNNEWTMMDNVDKGTVMGSQLASIQPPTEEPHRVSPSKPKWSFGEGKAYNSLQIYLIHMTLDEE